MIDRKRTKQLSILSVIRASDKPLTSSQVVAELLSRGHGISGRTVRLYLQEMSREGLVEDVGQRRRQITEQGLTELDSTGTVERVGFLSAKMDRMTYLTDFDVTNRSGSVVVNITLVEPKALAKRIDLICRVFEHGYAMDGLLALLEPRERIGQTVIPAEMLGIATVSSVTLNGVLLKHGVPTSSRFGGLLAIEDKRPIRFVEIIEYGGTSIDPLEVFIRSGMTDYIGAIQSGNGRIGATFREFPGESLDLVQGLAHKLQVIGLGSFLAIGRVGQALLDVPVSEGQVGAIAIGGLNPVAILEETGLRVYFRGMAGLLDFGRLFHYQELEDRVRAHIEA